MAQNSVLSLKHVFGLKGDVRNNLHYFDESHVIYPAGHNIVVYNIESRSQYKIQSVADMKEKDSSNSRTEITAMAISPNKKFLAVGERADRPQITIYDISSIPSAQAPPWKRRRPVIPNDITSPEFVCLAFSADSKSLLTLGGAPDWNLCVWHWEKGRCVNSVRVSNAQGAPVYSCSFCPSDPSFVCVTGNGILKFFRIEAQSGGELKPLQSNLGKREPQNYTCHAWLDDKLLVATDTGDILVFGEGGEFRGAIASPCELPIESLVTYSKGFVCGCPEGTLQVYEKDEKEGFKKRSPFVIKNNPGKVLNLCLSPSEDTLGCATDNNQAYTLPLASSDIQDLKFDLLAQPFHHMVITGLDVCVRKPLVVTCGIDKSVRIWNYVDHSLELMKYFSEEPYSVAFHPSGLHILVGFNDKLRLMNLLIEDIRPFKEFPIKACREVQFSNGGQYFAAVNGSTIQIYSTYTCENIGNCRGHNGKVRSIFWTADDMGLISCGMDGAVYEWELKEGTHAQEYVQKGCNYSSAVSSSEGKMYAVGSDRALKEISESTASGSWDAGVILTQLVIMHPPQQRMLFAGSENGLIKLFKFPLTGNSIDHYVHSGPVTRLRISKDDSYLFSVSEDGCLAIFEISGKDRARKDKNDAALPWAEEILVTKSELEEKLAMINDLKNKVEELQLHNEYQSRLREMNYQEKLRDVTEVFQKELAEDRQNYELLLDEKSDLEKQYSKRFSQLAQRHQDKLKQLESYHEQKLDGERQRYAELERKLELGIEKWREILQRREEECRQELEALKQDYQEKLLQEESRCTTILKDKHGIETEFDESKRMLEEDADRELDELKELYDKKIWSEQETEQKYAAENGILRLRYNGLKEEIAKQKEEIKARFEKEKSLYEQIHILEKDIEGFKKEISERDMTIDDKKKRIYDLRKKNQELEKFKFVLDYKIKELRRQIEPRELEIKEMEQQIAEMENELNEYKKNNKTLKLRVKELELKLQGLTNERDKQRESAHLLESDLQSLQKDLHEVVSHGDDIKAVKNGIKRLYQRHVTKEADVEADPDIHKEYQRQRYYLEKSVDSLKLKLSKDTQVHKKENVRIVQENVALIREINELRKEIKFLNDSQRAKSAPSTASLKAKFGSSGSLPPATSGSLAAMLREMEMQNEQIRALEEQLIALQQQGPILQAPPSRSGSAEQLHLPALNSSASFQ